MDEIENRNCFDAFLGSIPGNCAHNVRHPTAEHTELSPICFHCRRCGAEAETETNLYGGPPLIHTITGGSTPVQTQS